MTKKPLASAVSVSPDFILREVREKAKLSARIDADLGELLHQVREHDLYERSGRSSFKDFVETDLGIGYRRAMYLADIFVGASELGLTEADIVGLGWSIQRELMTGCRWFADHDRPLTVENKRALVEFARTHTRVELIAHLDALGVERSSEKRNGPAARKRNRVAAMGSATTVEPTPGGPEPTIAAGDQAASSP